VGFSQRGGKSRPIIKVLVQAAGPWNSDIPILVEGFLAELRPLPQCNPAVEVRRLAV